MVENELNSLSGPVRQQLIGCETLPVVVLEPIYCTTPEVDRRILRTDKKYFLYICLENHLPCKFTFQMAYKS